MSFKTRVSDPPINRRRRIRPMPVSSIRGQIFWRGWPVALLRGAASRSARTSFANCVNASVCPACACASGVRYIASWSWLADSWASACRRNCLRKRPTRRSPRFGRAVGQCGPARRGQAIQRTRNRKIVVFPGSGQYKKPPPWLVAGEIVETTQVYARQCGAIEPTGYCA